MIQIKETAVSKEISETVKVDIFSLYVSSEPGTRLPFTGASMNVGRTSSFATTTCSKLA